MRCMQSRKLSSSDAARSKSSACTALRSRSCSSLTVAVLVTSCSHGFEQPVHVGDGLLQLSDEGISFPHALKQVVAE